MHLLPLSYCSGQTWKDKKKKVFPLKMEKENKNTITFSFKSVKALSSTWSGKHFQWPQRSLLQGAPSWPRSLLQRMMWWKCHLGGSLLTVERDSPTLHLWHRALHVFFTDDTSGRTEISSTLFPNCKNNLWGLNLPPLQLCKNYSVVLQC